MVGRIENQIRTFGLLTLIGFSSIGLEGCTKQEETPKLKIEQQQRIEAAARSNFTQKVSLKIYNNKNELDKGETNDISILWYREMGRGREILARIPGKIATGQGHYLFANRNGAIGTRFSVSVNGQPAYWSKGGSPSDFVPWLAYGGSIETEFEFYKGKE